MKEAVDNLEEYHNLKLKACEIAFTYGIYIKGKEDALKIGKAAERLNVQLSIHAPYWINLNSAEKEKVEKSKERILKCCEVGHYLNDDLPDELEKLKKLFFIPAIMEKFQKSKLIITLKMQFWKFREK